jgi:hypothetical protein
MSDLGEIYLTLVPAPDEGDTLGEACQQALRDFYHVLRASRMKVMPRILGQGSVGAADSLTGEFVIPLATIVGPVLAAAVTSWFEGIAGRKLRLTMGDIDVEAQSEPELERLLEQETAARERQRQRERNRDNSTRR